MIAFVRDCIFMYYVSTMRLGDCYILIQKQQYFPHCSRITCNPILLPRTFFTFPHSYIMGTTYICKKIWNFAGKFWKNAKIVNKEIFFYEFCIIDMKKFIDLKKIDKNMLEFYRFWIK